MNGPGFDFEILWHIGQAILRGLSPYSLPQSVYPPAASLIFTPLALLPMEISYAMFLLANGVLLVALTKRRALGWMTYVPVLFMFAAGQTSLLLLPAILLLRSKRRWASGLAVALFLLKPQVAVVVLPWFMIRWLIGDRERLVWSAGWSLIINAAPLLYRPTIYAEWWQTTAFGVGHKFGGVGVWLLRDQLGLIVVGLLAAAISVLALRTDEKTSRALLTLANPVMAYYDTVILIDVAPWWMLGPVSLAALGIAHIIGGHSAFVLIPLSALLYRFSLRGLTIPAPASSIWPEWRKRLHAQQPR